MKKFSEFVQPVSDAIIASSIKEAQEIEAKKFQSLLEKFEVENIAALNEEDQAKFLVEMGIGKS